MKEIEKGIDMQSEHPMKIIKKFDSYSSDVELVEIDGTRYVLKTVDDEEAANEKRFLETLSANNLPSLELFNKASLESNQLLLEYVPNSEKVDYQDVNQVRQWGESVHKMHDIHFEKPFRITEEGKEEYFDWNDFLSKNMEHSVNYRKGGKTDLSDEELDRIVDYIKPRLNFNESGYSLLHGDMHDGNTLKRGGEVIIYDKSSEIFAGHYLYDLATVAIMYPNGLYMNTDEPEYKRDSELLNAFMEGYGENFVEKHKSELDVYMLIRNLFRYPNPFVRVERQIFKTILGE